jgi:hypothetical protein
MGGCLTAQCSKSAATASLCSLGKTSSRMAILFHVPLSLLAACYPNSATWGPAIDGRTGSWRRLELSTIGRHGPRQILSGSVTGENEMRTAARPRQEAAPARRDSQWCCIPKAFAGSLILPKLA